MGITHPRPIEDEANHRRVDREVDIEGQAVGQVLALFEVEDQGEGGNGQRRAGAEGQAENFPKNCRVEHGRHTGIEDIVEKVLASLEVDVLLHRVDEEDEGKDECQVEGAVAPLLQDAEARRVDVEDRKDDRHGEDQSGRHPREPAETHLGVVLGDLIRIFLDLGGC